MKSAVTPTTRTAIDLDRYYQRDSIFDHTSEEEFFKILRDEILGVRFFALTQVPLASLVGVRKQQQTGGKAHWGTISQRRVDFVICGVEDLKPKLVVELDGLSHRNQARKDRDEFVDSLFDSVGLPCMHIDVERMHDKRDIATEMALKLGLIQHWHRNI